MSDPCLFDVGERQKPTKATPAPPGTGPAGKTCRDCRHYCRVQHHDYFYLKCGMMESEWTHGKGTDIKASFPACRHFAEQSEE